LEDFIDLGGQTMKMWSWRYPISMVWHINCTY